MFEILDILMCREGRHAFYPRGPETAQKRTAFLTPIRSRFRGGWSGGFASEAIGDQVDESVGQACGFGKEILDNVCRGRPEPWGGRQHARPRTSGAIRAAIVFFLFRSGQAWHVAGHGGHIAHLRQQASGFAAAGHY